jgi:ppGpp synthetase/RelA/SpoT-type nucleotidyltranferase
MVVEFEQPLKHNLDLLRCKIKQLPKFKPGAIKISFLFVRRRMKDKSSVSTKNYKKTNNQTPSNFRIVVFALWHN